MRDYQVTYGKEFQTVVTTETAHEAIKIVAEELKDTNYIITDIEILEDNMMTSEVDWSKEDKTPIHCCVGNRRISYAFSQDSNEAFDEILNFHRVRWDSKSRDYYARNGGMVYSVIYINY